MTTPDGRTARATKKRQNRRRAILQAARRVFAAKGFHQTHVSDIIEAAGIARGTFYLYFESKNAIFLELLDELLAELRESIVGVDTFEGAPPVHLQLVDTVRRIMQTVVDNRALTRILAEAVGLGDEVEAHLTLFYRNLQDYIRDALENGKRMQLLREGIDTEIGSLCVMGTIKQFMEQLALGDEGGHLSQDVDRLAAAVLDFNLRGLLKQP